MGAGGGCCMHTVPTHPHITVVDPCASVERLLPGTRELQYQEQGSCLTVYMENRDSEVHKASKKLRV
jgi:hypothetical protein